MISARFPLGYYMSCVGVQQVSYMGSDGVLQESFFTGFQQEPCRSLQKFYRSPTGFLHESHRILQESYGVDTGFLQESYMIV